MRILKLTRAAVAAAILLAAANVAAASGIQVIPQSVWVEPESITPVSSFGTLQNSLLIPDAQTGYVYAVSANGATSSIFTTLTTSNYYGNEGTGAPTNLLLISSGPLAGSYLAFGVNNSDPANEFFSSAIFAFNSSGSSQLVYQSAVSGSELFTAIFAPSGFGQLGGQILVTQDTPNAILLVTPTSATSVSVSTFASLPIQPAGLLAAPSGFGSIGGKLLVSGANTGTIFVVDSTGNVTNFANIPLASGQYGLRQMAFAPAGFGSYGGDLLVSVGAVNGGGGTIGAVYVLNPAGTIVAVLNAATVGTGFDPRGIYFPSNAEVYISNGSSSPGLVVATASDFTPVPPGTLSTVTITTPSNGAAVSGTSIALSATATPGSGLTITNVQFQIDGTNVGSALTSSPYSTTFDSTTLTNGSHTLTAVATDSGNNTITSPLVTFTTTNTTFLDFRMFNTASYTQTAFGTTLQNYSFEMDDILQTPTSFSAETVTYPGPGSPATLTQLGTDPTFVQKFFGPYASLSALHSALPFGTYTNTFNYGVGTNSAAISYTADHFISTVPQLTAASLAALQNMDPSQAITLDFSGFTPDSATNDSVGTYVTIFGPHSSTVFTTFVTPAVTSVVIPAGTLTAGTTYSLQIAEGGRIETPANAGGVETELGFATDTTVTFTVSSSTTIPTSPLVTAFTNGALRNNFSGYVGMEFKVGASPINVTSLGRIYISGNSATPHTVKLVQASNGVDVPGGSVSVNVTTGTQGQFAYAELATPVELNANTSYYLVSQETTGGDFWYNITPVTSSSAASVVAPVYNPGNGYFAPPGYAGQSYVPVSLLYYTSVPTAPSVSITAPAPGAIVSGTSVGVSATATASMGLTITAVQFQIDGADIGGAITTAPYATTFDSTQLSNGAHTLTATASDSSGALTTSAPVQITVNNSPSTAPGTPLLSSFSTGVLRNNYTGFVGAELKVGSAPISVSALGRIYIAGNNHAHLIKLVNASTGADVPNGSVTLTPSGTAGQFSYATLPSPVTLAAGASYYLVSMEIIGGDKWYDITPVMAASAASIVAPVYFSGATYVPVAGYGSQSYVPVNLLYSPLTGGPTGSNPFVTTFATTTLRNNYSGFVGMEIQVGPTPLTVTALGRIYLAGNSRSHLLKLVTASTSADLPGGSVTLGLPSGGVGQFAYANLPAPVTLAANTTYYLLSDETAAGDLWYDYTTVTGTSVAGIGGPVYFNGFSYQLVGGAPNHSYVPVSFLYY